MESQPRPNNKELKRAMKIKRREDRRRDRERRRLEKNKKKTASNKIELGPLGNFLSAVIRANTWT